MPAKPALLAAVVGAAVRAAAPYGVPVTAKFRMGLFDSLLTYLRAGTVCESEGVAATAVHRADTVAHRGGGPPAC